METPLEAQPLPKTRPTTHGRFDLWRLLTSPHASITDIEMRRQSQLLSGLIVILLLTTVLAGVLLTIQARAIPDTVFFLLPGQLVSLTLYILNRLGRYRISAVLFVASNVLLIYVRAVLSQDVTWLLFAAMPILFSAILLGRRVTAGLFALSLLTLIALEVINPLKTTISVLGAIIIFGIIGSLVLVFVIHRQALEKERRQELQTANDRLRDSEASLKLLNDDLERRVEERTRDLKVARDQAEEARQRAERADQIKSQFLASMSHELRTPLNAILNFTEMTAMGMVGPVTEQQKDILTKSLDSGKHLLGLINDVLDVAKIQSGMLSLFIEDNVDLYREIEPVVHVAETLLKDKPVRLVTDIDADLPAARADRRRVRQVLLNLISNAAKFTEQGTVTLSAKKHGAEVLFAVADTGPGIEAAEQGIIFEPFIQTESGIRHQGGTGLGLPISKYLVEAHGGRLWVESEPGHGSTFLFSLPVRR